MKLIHVLIFCLLLVNGYSQDLQTFFPFEESAPDLSQSTFEEIARQNLLLSKKQLTTTEQNELDQLLSKYGEVVQSAWDVVHGDCSWYCGGGNYKIKASSSLTSKNDIYTAKSANDLSYKSAWVEGVSGDGKGEYLEYTFENRSPRITSIIVSNGFMKSDETWINNNRVKSLKLYVNDKPFGILQLSDSKTDQEFKIGTFGHNKDGSDLKFKFEILSVYKGLKYDDTAITEIYFDGIDVH